MDYIDQRAAAQQALRAREQLRLGGTLATVTIAQRLAHNPAPLHPTEVALFDSHAETAQLGLTASLAGERWPLTYDTLPGRLSDLSALVGRDELDAVKRLRSVVDAATAQAWAHAERKARVRAHNRGAAVVAALDAEGLNDATLARVAATARELVEGQFAGLTDEVERILTERGSSRTRRINRLIAAGLPRRDADLLVAGAVTSSMSRTAQLARRAAVLLAALVAARVAAAIRAGRKPSVPMVDVRNAVRVADGWDVKPGPVDPVTDEPTVLVQPPEQDAVTAEVEQAIRTVWVMGDETRELPVPGLMRMYEWVHGYFGTPVQPLRPHLELNGAQYSDADADEVLRVKPGQERYRVYAGQTHWSVDDHERCHCWEIIRWQALPAARTASTYTWCVWDNVKNDAGRVCSPTVNDLRGIATRDGTPAYGWGRDPNAWLDGNTVPTAAAARKFRSLSGLTEAELRALLAGENRGNVDLAVGDAMQKFGAANVHGSGFDYEFEGAVRRDLDLLQNGEASQYYIDPKLSLANRLAAVPEEHRGEAWAMEEAGRQIHIELDAADRKDAAKIQKLKDAIYDSMAGPEFRGPKAEAARAAMNVGIDQIVAARQERVRALMQSLWGPPAVTPTITPTMLGKVMEADGTITANPEVKAVVEQMAVHVREAWTFLPPALARREPFNLKRNTRGDGVLGAWEEAESTMSIAQSTLTRGGPHGARSVAVHESVHTIVSPNNYLREASKAYLARRAGPKFQTEAPGSYDIKTYEDWFTRPYSSRVYGDYQDFEVFTTGYEQLLSSPGVLGKRRLLDPSNDHTEFGYDRALVEFTIGTLWRANSDRARALQR